MYKDNDILVYSPSDLCRFLASPYASWMERYKAEKIEPVFEIDETDPLMGLLQDKGEGFEDVFLEKFRSEGKSISVIDGSSTKDKKEATLNAMKDGADVIYQACLENAPFRGYADFLIKVDGESKLGNYHYEVWDTKLSQHPKAYFFIQLCCYAEMLEPLQGCNAKDVVVVLGNEEQVRQPIDSIRYYYKSLKQSFLSQEDGFDAASMPDPVESKEWGRWGSVVASILEERDDLSLVATITKNHIKALKSEGITTMQELGESSISHVPKIQPTILERLKKQAAIQCRSKGQEIPEYEIQIPDSSKRTGLSLLPPESPLDVFFDIEGDPLMKGGLEYLWGNTYFDENGERQFKDFWAHDHEQEKVIFKEFIDWVYARWKDDPSMHIYHYANYEIAACRKLMGRYGICEDEVDQLLRNEVFVDLYNVVRHGLIIGEPRYSIKNVEHLYRGKRETEVKGGGESVAVYEAWLNDRDGNTWQTSKVLNDIREYNIDDCDSTQELVEWLRKRVDENSIKFQEKPEVEEKPLSEEVTARLILRDKLLQRAELEEKNDLDDSKLTEMFAWLLDFVRRQNKPVWWRLFERMGLTDIELVDDLDCIAMCQRTDREPFLLTKRTKIPAYEYSFDSNQEFKPPKTKSSMWISGHDDTKVTFIAINDEDGLITVQSKETPPEIASFIPADVVPAKVIEEGIEAVARLYDENKLDSSAIMDFLQRKNPRIKAHEGGPIITKTQPDERLKQIIQTVSNLDHSYICIQGPPGSGKSYTGARVIGDLVKQGKRIGIASNSHKAINNLLLGVAKYCNDQGIDAKCFATSNTGDELEEADIEIIKNDKLSENLEPGCVLGSTAWGFSRPDMVGELDYLFIDEAGQVSVAYLVAMSRSATNLVIKGDQMQLGQPVQGTHPGESGQSILEYLLQDHATIPPELGIFLDKTYRMHPDVNEFISNVVYEGRLETAPDNAKRIIQVPKNYKGILNKEAGIIFKPVEHEGNTQASIEEAEAIAAMAKELMGRTFINENGESIPLDWGHMLFVAPYNHQVNTLKKHLGEHAKVGSVDKFQGQEAPVVFLSLSVSDVNESPRGIEFVFNKNRLNVAISRAQCLAIMVGNPKLAYTNANSIEQIESVNLISRFIDEAR